jgi:hypothetical protein
MSIGEPDSPLLPLFPDGVLNAAEVHAFQYGDISDPLTHIEEVDSEIEFLMKQLMHGNDRPNTDPDVKTLKASKEACKEQMHLFVHTLLPVDKEGSKVEL